MAFKRVLFIIRKSEKRNPYSHGSFGLSNSATFVANKLNELGHECKLVTVRDNNDIDREVYNFQPDLVIIEALWVVPPKFAELLSLHPRPQWMIRIHSKAPFLAMEGVAMDWLQGYHAINQVYGNLSISCNNKQFNDELNQIKDYESIYLPNIYCPSFDNFHHVKKHDHLAPIDIGCFGAIRPFKNQLLQGMAAILFGKSMNRLVNFHINGTRPEQAGENVLRNLRGLFAGTPHRLIEHDWYSHDEFVQKMLPQIDIGMQVSFSESFNIVTADFVHAGVPIVVSQDVDWMPRFTRSNPNSVEDIVKKMNHIWATRTVIANSANRHALAEYNRKATEEWETYLKNLGE